MKTKINNKIIIYGFGLAGVISALKLVDNVDPSWLIAAIACCFAVKYLPIDSE